MNREEKEKFYVKMLEFLEWCHFISKDNRHVSFSLSVRKGEINYGTVDFYKITSNDRGGNNFERIGDQVLRIRPSEEDSFDTVRMLMESNLVDMMSCSKKKLSSELEAIRKREKEILELLKDYD